MDYLIYEIKNSCFFFYYDESGMVDAYELREDGGETIPEWIPVSNSDMDYEQVCEYFNDAMADYSADKFSDRCEAS